MKKFEITEEQIKELANKDQIVEELLNDWFPDSFVKLEGWLKLKYNQNDFMGYFNGKNWLYGFNYRNEWVDKIGDLNRPTSSVYEKCSKEEINERMIKESKKRGFVHGVYGNNSMIEFNGCIPDVSKRCKLDFKLGYAPFEQYNDLRIKGTTPCNSAFIIFKDGVWAEVIKPKYYTKAQAEKRLTELENDGYQYEIID